MPFHLHFNESLLPKQILCFGQAIWKTWGKGGQVYPASVWKKGQADEIVPGEKIMNT